MKRLLVLSSFWMILASPLHGAPGVSVDLYGAFLGIGKTVNQAGGGGALAIGIVDNLSLVYRGMYAVASRKTPDLTGYLYKTREMRYNHMMQMAGAEYVLMIPRIRLGWRNSLMVGYSQTRIDMVDGERNLLEAVPLAVSPVFPAVMQSISLWRVRRVRDRGFAVAAWTGFQVNALPYLAPFADIGIHKSFYDRDLEGKKIIGFHLMCGVRLNASYK